MYEVDAQAVRTAGPGAIVVGYDAYSVSGGMWAWQRVVDGSRP